MDLKDIRLIALVIFLIVSTYFLFSPFIFKSSGVMVTFVDKDNECSKIKEGDIVTQIGGFVISNSEDFEKAIQTIKDGEYATMVINNGPGGCKALKDSYIGIDVADIPSNQLKFGLDIQGGKVTVLKPGKTLDLTELEKEKEIIEKRIKSLGLPETKVYSSDDTLKIVSLIERISTLIKPGYFEAKIGQDVELEDGKGKIRLGDNFYDIELTNGKLKINDSYYQTSEIFLLEGIEFNIINITNSSFTIESKVFDNDDVRVLSTLSFVRLNPDFRVYEFNIPLEISSKASERFKKITKGLRVSFVGRKSMLEGSLIYYLDGNEISRLNIPFEMAGKDINNIAVVGFGSKEEAERQRSEIQAILESGRLNEFKIVGKEFFEPKLRNIVIELSLLTMLAIPALTFALIHLRYKNKKVFFIPLLIGTEIFCIVGIAALTQFVFAPGWILDFPSALGLIAFSFLSFSLLTLRTEEEKRQRKLFLWYRYKRLFSLTSFFYFSIFIFSFVLLFTVIKGLGFSLLTGLLIGILTKPIYANFKKLRLKIP